jgi:hypothetical protein
VGEGTVDIRLSSRIANALDGTEGILWHSSDLDGPELRRDLRQNTDSECETGRTSEEASFALIFVCSYKKEFYI